MMINFLELFPAEREALLEALRRDLRSESKLAKSDADWAICHQRNVQLAVRLLAALNPKGCTFSEQVCKSSSINHAKAYSAQRVAAESVGLR